MAGTYKAAQRKYYLSHHKPEPHRDVTCGICGTSFVASGRGTGNKKYCSKECAATALSIYKMDMTNRRIAHTIEIKCAQCGKQFTTAKTKQVKFCSKACRMEYYGHKKQEHICLTCGKSFYPKWSGAGKYCSIECCGVGQRKGKSQTRRKSKEQKKADAGKRKETLAAEKKKRQAEAIKTRRHEIAVRLNLFRVCKNVKIVSEMMGENVSSTRWFLRDSPSYLRYIDSHGSWRARELLYGMTSKKYRLEINFCEDLHKIIESAGYMVTREKTINGNTDRRIDLVASHIFGTYGIEAKNTNKAQKADQCIGQAVVKCHIMGYTPVCAFPSDCMPDAVFMHVARDMGVRVVNELTICKELFGHE